MPTPEEIAAQKAADEAKQAEEQAKKDKELSPVPYSRFAEVNEAEQLKRSLTIKTKKYIKK